MTCFGQQTGVDFQKSWRVGLGTSLNAHSFVQGDNGIYKELTVDYSLTDYFSTGVYIGHQDRSYSFPSMNSTGLRFFQYNQNLTPVGIRANFNLTSFINEKVSKSILPANKWEVYLSYFAGMVVNKVTDRFDRNAHNSPDTNIDYTYYLTNEDISYHAGLLTGATYYPVNSFGVFLEFGLGTIGNVNTGIRMRF